MRIISIKKILYDDSPHTYNVFNMYDKDCTGAVKKDNKVFLPQVLCSLIVVAEEH